MREIYFCYLIVPSEGNSLSVADRIIIDEGDLFRFSFFVNFHEVYIGK